MLQENLGDKNRTENYEKWPKHVSLLRKQKITKAMMGCGFAFSDDKLTCINSCLGGPYLFEFYNDGRIFLKFKL